MGAKFGTTRKGGKHLKNSHAPTKLYANPPTLHSFATYYPVDSGAVILALPLLSKMVVIDVITHSVHTIAFYRIKLVDVTHQHDFAGLKTA